MRNSTPAVQPASRAGGGMWVQGEASTGSPCAFFYPKLSEQCALRVKAAALKRADHVLTPDLCPVDLCPNLCLGCEQNWAIESG